MIRESVISAARNFVHGEALDDDLILLDGRSIGEMSPEPIRLNYIFVGVCRKGTAWFHIDEDEIEFQGGMLVVVNYRRVVQQLRTTADFDGSFMIFSPKFFNDLSVSLNDLPSLYLISMRHPIIRLTDRETQQFTGYFQAIRMKLEEHGNPFRSQVVHALFVALTYDLGTVKLRLAQEGGTSASRADVIFEGFIRLLEANFMRERRVGWYSEQLCISPKHLSHTVKQVSRLSPNDWISRYVVDEMRRRLRNTRRSVKEIAAEMGFPNQSFFGTYFKLHTGVSPLQYRRS